MNQVDLDRITEMGLFSKSLIPGSTPPRYRAVRTPVYALSDPEGVIDCYGDLWLVGWHDGKLWKVKA